MHDNIADIEKPDGICSPTFIVDEFQNYFLDPSVFSIKHLKSAKIINGASLDFWC